MRKILIVDDNELNRVLLKKTLSNEYDIIEAQNGKEALAMMRRHYKILSAILLDIVMPEMNGYEVLQIIRDNPLLAQIPVIIVTGSEDEESRVKALSLGANDFILKPFNPDIIRHCLKNNIALRETASILNAIQKDKLTGLYNREAFFEKANLLIKDHDPGHYILSCFDIVSFKLINDQYGAAEGDRILSEIGHVVRDDMERLKGIGARISADNFAVLMPNSKSDVSILSVLQQNRMAFSGNQPFVFSVGRCVVSDLSLKASALYDRAYIAKQSVKGRYDKHMAYFDDTMLEKLVRDQQIIAEMDIALKQHQFEVWFQPQCNHSTGAFIGAEALVRWRHPEKGLIPPNDFIPLFEQNGFIYELDKYVWEETCRYIRKWLDMNAQTLPVSVNLSRYDIFRTDLIDVLTGLLDKYSIPVSMLRLEVTESAFAQSTQVIVGIVKQLIDNGFTVEIDDFGNGYSSLNTLKDVPAQIIKLDMKFLENSSDSERGGNIVESVVRMAKWLGISVIAEGVETIKQADYLRSVGCNYMQGYLFAKPMPADEYYKHFAGSKAEKHLLSMDTVENLDNNSFWNPDSMDTLIFNSYVGGACIFEYHNGTVELIRATEKYAKIFCSAGMSVEDALKLNWTDHLEKQCLERIASDLQRSAATGEEVSGEYVFIDLPGCPHETHLRSTMRVIATAGDRYLVYCMNENITAQRQSEKREREAAQKAFAAKERFQLLLSNMESSVLAVVFPDSGCRIVFANNKYYSNLGYEKQEYEAEQRDPISFVHPDDRERFIRLAKQVFEDGKACSVTYRAIRRNGSVFWHQSHISLVHFPDEELPVQLAVSDDITALKEAEGRLEEDAARMQLINDSVPGGLAVYEGKPDELDKIRITYFNDGFCRLFGYSRTEYEKLSAKNPMALVFPEDVQRMFSQIKELIANKKPMDYVYRAKIKDKGYRWINVRAVMGKPKGDNLTVNAIFVDVTEQTDALERLRVSDEEYKVAMQLSGNVVCRYNIAERTLTVSTKVTDEIGSPKLLEDVPYGPIHRGKISPETAKAYTNIFEGIQSGTPRGSGVFKCLMNGNWCWLEAKYSTVFSSNGEPISAIIAFLNITERQEQEIVYKIWLQSLEDRNPESYTLFCCNLSDVSRFDQRSGKLINFNFRGSGRSFNERAHEYIRQCVYEDDRKKYEQLINADSLLAGYYRGNRSDKLEYREITTDVMPRWIRLKIELAEVPNTKEINAYLLYEDINEEKQAELKEQILAEADPLTGLLNRHAFINKLENQKQQERTLSALYIIDLDGFKAVNDTFGHATGDEALIEIADKLRSTFREEDLLCRFGGDEFMVYMRDIKKIASVESKASLLCALLHKSFNPDVQLSASIGIAIYPNDGNDFDTLYRKADTALYHVKETGKDSYVLYCDKMQGEEISACSTSATASEKGDAVSHTSIRRMLIVEDNAVNKQLLVNLFKNQFVVNTASEGASALTQLKRYGSEISVVLLDLLMPGMDGLTLLDKMRENPIMQTIPVIVVSALDERETCLEAIRRGAAEFVTKPVDRELLKLRVASALSRAENEQLLAHHRYLAIQNEEARRLSEAKKQSKELSVALREAERADLAKTQFLSSMSHEIRTPLNALIGYNSLAKSELSEAHTDAQRRHAEMKVMDCLTKSDVASRHLLSIINDVLDMSAIESGKLTVEKAPFDFRSLITSLTVMFFSQSRAKGVNFEVMFDKPVEEWFVGDQMRINQVLTNLLSNAVKFTPEGGNVKLSISECSTNTDTMSFRFTVEDTGIGMTQEYLSHIWTPFEQAEASISRRFGGTGLGLSITKNLVDLMGGSIDVESESGIGSKFTVELTFERTEQPRKINNVGFSDINALVVDDDAGTCDYIKLLFDRCGATCSTYTSGAAAVDAFAAAKGAGKAFNVCLVDWRMPEMDGFATVAAIRRISGNYIPIVVVTAYDFSEVSSQAEKLSINRFISKPLFQSSLFDLLSTISGRSDTPQDEKPKKYDFGGAKVLLAEDNNMNMEVAKRILQSANLEVESAWNGQEAVDIFAASVPGTYKLILMDVHMPIVDGYQATRLIRSSEHPDAKTIPILAMTADVFAEDIAEAHNVGMNDHVAKPIDIDALFNLLTSYIEN